MRIENWSIIAGDSNPYLAPEMRRRYIFGNVFGHPKFSDGKSIRTSHIIGIEGQYVLTKSGSRYELGNPHPDYEAKFSDAKKRLFKSLF